MFASLFTQAPAAAQKIQSLEITCEYHLAPIYYMVWSLRLAGKVLMCPECPFLP